MSGARATEPVVSVIIPAYNATRTLEATLRSALAQTVRNIEVTIVDDGSKDDTLAFARRLAAVDDRVRVLTRPNGGVAAARNTGIRAARGRYVALLDADDLWVPHKLERQLRVLESDRKVYAVQAGATFVDDDLNVLSVRPCQPSRDALLETLLFQNMPNNMSTLVIRRERFDEMGYFDEDLTILEEWDMGIKVARFCNLVSIEEPLSLYRVHTGNRSRNIDIHVRPGLLVLERLFADATLPGHIRRRRKEIYGTFYRMLAGGYFNAKQHGTFARWMLKSLRADPAQIGYVLRLPLRRWQRSRSRLDSVKESRTPIA